MFEIGDEVVFINDNNPIVVGGHPYVMNNSNLILGKIYTIIDSHPNSIFIKVDGQKNFNFKERFVSLSDYRLMQVNYRKQKLNELCLKLETM